MDSNLRNQLSAIVHDIFKNYTPGNLHGLVGYVRRPFLWQGFNGPNSEIVDECLDELKDACFNRIHDEFDREKSILTTLQVRRFGAYRDAYKEHYATMYERHTASDDPLSKLGDAVGDFVEKKIEELMPGGGDSLRGPNRQDILGIVRMKSDPVGYQTSEALKIMAEVRSYYDCKYRNRSAWSTLSRFLHSGNAAVHRQCADDPGPIACACAEGRASAGVGREASNLWSKRSSRMRSALAAI
jgi:hypothetical protein